MESFTRLRVNRMTRIVLKVIIKIHLIVILFFNMACSTLSTDDIAPGIRVAYDSMKKAVFGYPDNVVTKELVESIPFATLSLQIGKGPKGLLVLEEINNEGSLWASRDRVYIRLAHGRIVRTLGLENNLKSYYSPDIFFYNLVKEEKPVFKEFYAYYSYDEPELNNLKTKVQIREVSEELINILGKERKVLLFEEKIRNNYLGWKISNFYWVDREDGFVWKSSQHISPKLPEFKIEITKKPAL